MCYLYYGNIMVIIGISSLMQLHMRIVHSFIINKLISVPSVDSMSRASGLDTNDGFDGRAVCSSNLVVASSSTASLSQNENTWLDLQYSEDALVPESNNPLTSFEDEKLQELCAIEKSFDVDETATKRRSIKHQPKKRKHLFRYSPDISVACWLATVTTLELLESAGFTKDNIDRMTLEFPRLIKMDAKNMIAPKLRFLVNVLGGGSGDIGNGVVEDTGADDTEFLPHNLRVSEFVRDHLSPEAYFGCRMETAIGPRHAYLALHKTTLPYGKELMGSTASDIDSTVETLLLDQFLDCCSKKPAKFAQLCNEWESRNVANRPTSTDNPAKHTAETVMAMDNAFSDALGTFARNIVTPDCRTLGCTPGEMVSLLLDHGANYAEHDDWGATALHWAAGTGNIDGIKSLMKKLERDERDMDGDVRDVLWSTCASCYSTKDLATPLHWAAAGVNHTHFGCGGDIKVCRFLLDKAGDKMKSFANSATLQGNTPFMWACWSGSLDVAKLLVGESNVDPFVSNADGSTAAHWAASGGHVCVCEFLRELGMSFEGEDSKNKEGHTPLGCAKSYGCTEVVDWVEKHRLGP